MGKEYYLKNEEKLLKISKKYYQQHKKERLIYVKKYRMAHPDKCKEASKKYRNKNKEKIRKYYREWYLKNGRNRANNYVEAILEWRQLFPERAKASSQLQYALKKGIIERSETCQQCNRIVKTQGHHENYLDPLGVEWLCASCHKLKHENT